MIGKNLLCTVLSGLFLTAGCNVFSDPDRPQVITNDDNRVILMQADRRAIFTFDKGKSGRVCPEPSPDVRADVESAIKSLISGSVDMPTRLSAEAKTELNETRKLITQALLKRSQGLQVLRDLLFQACVANLRGDLPAPQYMTFVTVTLPRLTSTLITTELISTMTSDGKTLPKEVVEAIVKYQVVATAAP
jgi:hypothetical protein